MAYDFLAQLEHLFNSSPLIGLGVSFLAGVLVSFSPCIYPLIPITLGVIGATAAKGHAKGFAATALFVLGICVTYTTLGVVASFFGVLFSKFFLNPFSYILLIIFFAVGALSLLDIIKINIPFFNFSLPHKRQGFWLFVMGLASGLAVIPCNFPVLGTILALISRKQNVLYGALCLFLFSLGYGTILLIVGAFGSLIVRLPKQGNWLNVIKKILGVVLLVVAAYFVKQLMEVIR